MFVVWTAWELYRITGFQMSNCRAAWNCSSTITFQAFVALFILYAWQAISLPVLGQSNDSAQASGPESGPELVLQMGHVDQPSSISLGASGTLLVTSSADKIILWDATNGTQLRSFVPTLNGLQYVGAALGLDDKTAVGLDRYHLDFWNTSTGALERQLDLSGIGALGVDSMKISPDRASVVLAASSGSGVNAAPFILSLATGLRVAEFEGTYKYSSLALAFSFDGHLVADGNYEQFVRVHDATTGKLVAEFAPKAGPVDSVAFSPDGGQLAASTNDACHSLNPPGTSSVGSAFRGQDCTGHIFVWDLATKSLVWSSPNRAHFVGDLAFSSTDRLLVAFGTQAEEWQVRSEFPVATLDLQRPIQALTLDPRRNILATTGWSTAISTLKPTMVRWQATSKADLAASFAVSKTTRSFIIGERTGSLLILSDANDTHMLRSTKISGNWVRKIALNDGAGLIAVPKADLDSHVLLLNSKDGSLVRDVPTPLRTVSSVSFSPDGKLLAIGGDSRDPRDSSPHPNPKDPADPLGMFTPRVTIALLDVAKGDTVRTLETDSPIQDVAFTRDGRLIGHIEFSSNLWEWRAADGSILHAPHRDSSAPPEPFGSSIPAISSDGTELAQYDGNNLILVDTATLKPIRPPMPFFDLQGSACAFSSDGKLLAVGERDITLLDVKNGAKLRVMTGNGDHVSGLQFSSDANFLFSTSFDGALRIWSTRSGKLLLTLLFPSEDGSEYEWLAITPDGLFDGTAKAMRSVAWRTRNTNDVVPLDAFFTDFYHPGVFAEVMSGKQPKATVDIATALQVPGLRAMLAQKEAHIEDHNGQVVVCFEQKPGAAINVGPNDQRIFFPPVNGYEPGSTPTCRFEKRLSPDGNSADRIKQLENWKPETITTPWDGKSSGTAHSTLHVLTIGVSQYPEASGFDPLPFASPSARAIEEFFRGQQTRTGKGYAMVRVWEGLYDRAATREALWKRLSGMAEQVRENDVVLLYLAGHGEVSPGEEMFYFVPVDGRDDSLRDTALSTAFIAEAVRNLPARRIMLIVDACQSGGAIEALSKVAVVKAQVEQRREQQRKLAPGLVSGVGVHLIAATLPLSYAVGLKAGQSVLAQTLLQALHAGTGTVTAHQLSAYLKDSLPATSERITHGFRQVPLVDSIGLDFAIAAR
jgi:WD40 repeat protein